ncbi:MAG: NAD-dependent epimerase/dehydratase family protein [Candidatus Sericytochromatia bacterium]|uniref:NAD-dependent epimerase/dehydratase family protein n=1 Tax=Candidatus Tanganyikabacteria bacterium TaxID=2961651 RepID=A0A937X662_9BACT|nr:NAD-dependent epimerase/dehydratase family protein [Candidatus Tanganyikabacteria bacterium]
MLILTGATGFLGRAVVTELHDQPLKALCRTPAPDLETRGVAVAIGSLLDRAWVESQISAGDTVVHMAGKVEFTASGIREMHSLHVEATRVVAGVAAARGARLILLSSSGTTAISRHDRPVDERASYPMELVSKWPYYLSKTLQERLVLDMASREQLDAVVLNPSLLLGPGDERVGSTSVVRDFLASKIPTVPPGGISVVDVRDTAAAVRSSLTRGKPGERYFLAGHNCRFSTFFRVLEAISGVRAPYITIPGRIATLGARAVHRLKDGAVPHPAMIEMANYFWYADSQKAARELGFAPRPLEATLRDTIAYLRDRAPDRTKYA